MRAYHEPVMGPECIEALQMKPDGVYVDATFGGGGHSTLMLEQLGPSGRLFGFDQDPDAVANALPDSRFTLIQQNFRFLKRFLKLYGIAQVDGILADLGVSSHQLNEATRGFSYRFDSLLDMRMNPSEGISASAVVNDFSAAELQRIFSEYGEVRNARTLADRIVEERSARAIQTIGDLLSVMEPVIRGNRLRYLSQVFQALRMQVNDETGALKDLLAQACEVIRPGGRLVVISYHSIEDRLVKNFLKTGNAEGAVQQDFYGHIHRPFILPPHKMVQPSAEELQKNPRARSAKLRWGTKNE